MTQRTALKQVIPQHVIDFAVEVAGSSPCRSKRGVVIFRGDDILAHGYNYKPKGFDCDGSEACKATCRVEAIHAEQMALLSTTRTISVEADMVHVKAIDGDQRGARTSLSRHDEAPQKVMGPIPNLSAPSLRCAVAGAP